MAAVRGGESHGPGQQRLHCPEQRGDDGHMERPKGEMLPFKPGRAYPGALRGGHCLCGLAGRL